jgi:hypothetical protein
MQRILFLFALVLSSLTNVLVHAEEPVNVARQQFNEGMEYYTKSKSNDCDANCSKAYGLFVNSSKGGDCDATMMVGLVNKEKTKNYLVGWKAFLLSVYQCNHMLGLYHLGDMEAKGLIYDEKSDFGVQVMYYLALHGNLPNQKQSIVDMYFDGINEKFNEIALTTGMTLEDFESFIIETSSKEDLQQCKSSPRDCFVFEEYFTPN